MIQVDLDQIPGYNLDSCDFKATYSARSIPYPSLSDEQSRGYLSRYDPVLLVERKRVWPGNNLVDYYPDDWISIRHRTGPTMHHGLDVSYGVSWAFDYSIEGWCKNP